MSKSSAVICLLLTIALAIFFVTYANIDLAVTHYFYIPVGKFKLNVYAWDLVELARTSLYYVVWGTSLFVLLMLLLRLLLVQFKRIPIKTLLYILAVFILVPTLLINVLFKDQFGRARPRDVLEFGGTHQFLPAWSISRECTSNCSFVCGDSSAVFAFWLFLPFFKQRRNKFLYGSGVFLVGAFYGFIRVGQGAHFFSDVVFSALLSYLGIWLVYAYFYLLKPTWADEVSLVKAFARGRRFILRR